MQRRSCGHADIIISGKTFRTVSEAAWDVSRRTADMERMGIARQVLSPMPELLSYWLPVEDAVILLRHVNASIAEMVCQAPDRLIGMAAVPLQDVDSAIREMRHAKEKFALTAVEVGSNVNGVPIGDLRFEPFFEAADNLGIAIFVHALRAAGKERLVGPPMLEQIVAFPSEMALAAASLVTSGILARHPRLRIAFSHGGGGFAATLARMDYLWANLPTFQAVMPEAPRVSAGRAFYDLTVFDPVIVKLLVEMFGVDQLLLGSDYPFGAHEPAPIELLQRSGLERSSITAIAEANARRYLALG
jgi:aminocarboxymuconate-semialdehyde decarboxylase